MARILVADDDELLLELVKFKLEAKGYDVVQAENGETALELAMSEQPKLIVLDAMMPGIDGFELLRLLKQQDETSGIPVIMLTARKEENDVVSGFELGASDYLVKPFMPEELVQRIQRVLREHAPLESRASS